MKKIGILTHYYKSLNYGGNLQAYALVKFLNNHGYDAEQICFVFNEWELSHKSSSFAILKKLRKLYKSPYIFIKRLQRKHEEKHGSIMSKKIKAFDKFNGDIICHSIEVYRTDNLINAVENYDIFITGSDQVWNLYWFKSGFFLDFVPSDKIKISYAASFGSDKYPIEKAEMVKAFLQDYTAISVREQSAVDYLAELDIDSQLTCDSVFLLGTSDWDKLASPKLIEKEYLFCYFLGDNQKSRSIAKKYATKHNLRLVNIPHADGGIRMYDINFGDDQLFDATPEDFISLIKYAKCVFTDSFHAIVFSNIYQKQYFVFNREEICDMNTRIFNITELFNQEERFCFGKNQSLKYVESLNDIDYSRDNSKFEKLKKDSIDFLIKNLGPADEINE